MIRLFAYVYDYLIIHNGFAFLTVIFLTINRIDRKPGIVNLGILSELSVFIFRRKSVVERILRITFLQNLLSYCQWYFILIKNICRYDVL